MALVGCFTESLWASPVLQVENSLSGSLGAFSICHALCLVPMIDLWGCTQSQSGAGSQERCGVASQQQALKALSQTHPTVQAAAAGEPDGADGAEAAALPGHPAQRRPGAPVAADRAVQPQHVRLLAD